MVTLATAYRRMACCATLTTALLCCLSTTLRVAIPLIQNNASGEAEGICSVCATLSAETDRKWNVSLKQVIMSNDAFATPSC